MSSTNPRAGECLAAAVEEVTAELAEFAGALSDADLKRVCDERTGLTVASVIAHAAAGTERILGWLATVAGPDGSGLAGRDRAGRAAGARTPGAGAPGEDAGANAVIARFCSSQDAVSDLLRGMSDGQLDAAPPKVAGWNVADVPLGELIGGLVERQRSALGLMEQAVRPPGAGRSAERPVRRAEARSALRFPDEVSPPSPPPVPDGWSVAPPDFVGVGAQRSGTSWWYQVIASHPRVARPPGRQKELHFFDHYCGAESVPADSYHRYFPRPPGQICGEWTPRYMYDYWTPPMLHAIAPEARLLVILRDPVDRYLSGLTLNGRFGFGTSPMVAHHQFWRGFYWSQLRGLLEHFEPSRLLVLQYERCVADPVPQASRTFEFLGLDPDEWGGPEEMPPHVNPSWEGKPAIGGPTLAALRRAYQAELRLLFEDFPEIDGALWPTAAEFSGPHAQ